MRPRHPEAASEAACPRCAALLRPAVSTCSLCGWSVGTPFPEPAATQPVAQHASPADEPVQPAGQPPASGDVAAEEHAITELDAPAVAQLEALDALAEGEPRSAESIATTASKTQEPARTPALVPAAAQVGARELDPLTAPLALLTGAGAWLSEPVDVLPAQSPTVEAPGPSGRPGDAVAAEHHDVSDGAATVETAESAGAGGTGRPVRRLGDVLGLLSALVAVLFVAHAVLAWTVSGAAVDGSGALASIGLAAALFGSVVCLAMALVLWVSRARSNAQAQSVVRQRWSPTLSVAGWFIPVAGLFIGWQVLQDLWAAADPVTRDDPDTRAPEPLLITGWLAGLAISSVVWLAGSVVLGGSPLVDLVSALALGVSAGCLGLTVRRISHWQDPAPAPTGS